jgi:hypothetical protein
MIVLAEAAARRCGQTSLNGSLKNSSRRDHPFADLRHYNATASGQIAFGLPHAGPGPFAELVRRMIDSRSPQKTEEEGCQPK